MHYSLFAFIFLPEKRDASGVLARRLTRARFSEFLEGPRGPSLWDNPTLCFPFLIGAGLPAARPAPSGTFPHARLISPPYFFPSNPNTPTPSVVPTYTLPFAIIGVMNLFPAPK
jgi:hypothetical protein